jgi:hypothetical protein
MDRGYCSFYEPNLSSYQAIMIRIVFCIDCLCPRVNCSGHDLNFTLKLLVVEAVSHVDVLSRPAKAQCYSFMFASCLFNFDILNSF